MSLTYFPVTGVFKAVVSDTSHDTGGDPDIQNISSFVYFKPSAAEVHSTADDTTYRLVTIRARTNPSDGALKNIDGTTVTLVANTSDLEIDDLSYQVTFDNVVYAEKSNQIIDAFSFLAPTTNTPVDLTTVERLP